MKKAVGINEVSKEELYDLYLRLLKKNEKLEAKFLAMQMELGEKNRRLEEYNFQLAKRNRIIFGKRREINKLSQNKFNEAECNQSKKPYRKRDAENIMARDFLERNFTEEISLDPDEIRDNPSLIRIGEDITFKIESMPARLRIIKVISNKYKDKKTGKIYQKLKDDKYPHSFCTPSFASEVVTNKFVLGTPFYRQSKYLYDDGLSISRQTLCNYQMRTAEIIRPMYDFLARKLLATSAKVLHADETTLRVLNKDKSKCYVWLFNTSFYDNPIFIYRYSDTRSAKVPQEFLKDYSGYLISDCYAGYNNLPNVENSYCWAHARRNFIDILDALSDEQKASSISQKIVDGIDELFRIEREYRKKMYTATRIAELRNQGPFKECLDKIFKLLEEANPSPKSRLETAVKYILDRKQSFLNILKDGHLELSNNSAERGIKPFVIARKNFLFSNTENGAESSAMIFSIIQTAIANGLKAREYLEKLITEIPENPTEEELEKLLPWNIKS